jgi:hypothetical protein
MAPLPAPKQAKATTMPAEQGLWLEDDRCVDQGREQPVEADEDQTICGLQPGSDRRRPLQDNELLPQVEDLSLSSGLRATQPRQQRRKKSQNMDHSAKSISDWKAVDRLDKFFSSHTSDGRPFLCRPHRA